MADATSPDNPLQQEVVRLRHRVAALEAAQTAQAQRTQALTDAQELAEKVIETIRDPLLILHPDLRVQTANPAFYQLFQVDPADTLGRRIYALVDLLPSLKDLGFWDHQSAADWVGLMPSPPAEEAPSA